MTPSALLWGPQFDSPTDRSYVLYYLLCALIVPCSASTDALYVWAVGTHSTCLRTSDPTVLGLSTVVPSVRDRSLHDRSSRVVQYRSIGEVLHDSTLLVRQFDRSSDVTGEILNLWYWFYVITFLGVALPKLGESKPRMPFVYLNDPVLYNEWIFYLLRSVSSNKSIWQWRNMRTV